MNLFLVLLLLSSFGLSHEKPLNIVLILADDLGWNDVSFHGSDQIFTPNIDALAYNGIVLNNFYAQYACTPSRAALLTGMYPMRLGLQGYPLLNGEDRALPLNVTILPDQLKKIGYQTHLIGKWHLGFSCEKVTPTARGFDTFLGFYGGYVGYYDYKLPERDFIGFDFRNGTEVCYDVVGRYALDVITERALEIIKQHDKAKPMFLMISQLAPHVGELGSELTVKNETEVNLKFGYIEDEKRRRYADIVEKLDESVGRIVSTLFKENLLDNSIIFFLSDNGGKTYGMHENRASNWPFKGMKMTLLNGGVRVPSIIYSPTFKNQGVIVDGLTHITDLFKTIYSAAGGDSNLLEGLDSEDLWEVLMGNGNVSRREVLLEYDRDLGVSGIIHGKYKLIKGSMGNGFYDNRTGETGRNPMVPKYNVTAVLNSEVNKIIRKLQTPLTATKILETRNRLDLGRFGFDETEFNCSQICLFDLETDPLEMRNIADEFEEVVQELLVKIEDYGRFSVARGGAKQDVDSDPDRFNGTWSSWLEGTERCA